MLDATAYAAFMFTTALCVFAAVDVVTDSVMWVVRKWPEGK